MIRAKEYIVGSASDMFDERNISVSVEDEGGGPFIEISNVGVGSVRIDFEEMPSIVSAVEMLMEEWVK